MDYLQDDTESKVAAIWGKILNSDDIDIDSNFFDAGGTSLNIKQLADAIEKELKIKISMLDFFQYTTIASLASYIEGKK